MMGEDDPKKCTSAKLTRFKLATPIYSVKRIPRHAILLNPYSHETLSPKDQELLKYGLVAVDCSWKNCEAVFRRRWRGVNRRLPLLWAANPIHYGHPSILSSAEALAAALYITGYKEEAKRVLSIFKWGETFLTLNHNILEDYSRCGGVEDVLRVEREYRSASP